MKAVVGLLLMLLGVRHGVETYCDGRQGGAQNYGAVGGTVHMCLQPMKNNVSKINHYRWKLNQTAILTWKPDDTLPSTIKGKYFFTPSNRTFRINNLSRNDGGNYTVGVYDSNGTQLESQELKLLIQAPVSSVRLVSECLSHGEMNVSCSSEEGDSPQYKWILDGQTLTDTQLLSGNHNTSNIILRQNVAGRLICSVWNHISNASKERRISTCGFVFINCTNNEKHISEWVFAANNTLCIESTTAPTTNPGRESPTLGHWYVVAGALAVLVVGVAVICLLKKKKNNSSKEEADEQELTYADVRIVQRPGLQAKQREELEVEYGQVKFSV